MGNIGPMEILLIALVALLLFGAGRIADIGKGLGQGIKNFKQGLKEAEELEGPKKVEQLPPPARTRKRTAAPKPDRARGPPRVRTRSATELVASSSENFVPALDVAPAFV